MEIFDVIIIGVGQAGNPLSTAFASAGKKTAIIEEKFVGGSCINYGCTPTKIMAASAERAQLAQENAELGILNADVSVDLQKVVERKDKIVHKFRSGIAERINNSEAELIYGKASFSAPKTVTIDLKNGTTRTLKAETIIIDSGAKPRIPDLDGLEQVNYLDSTSIMKLKHIPDHLLVLGGGYIALEFAQMFLRFGSQVDIIEMGDQLMIREDKDVASAVQDILEKDGITVWLNAKATRVTQNSSDELTLSFQIKDKKHHVKGSHLLIATGRISNNRALNLQATGVDCDKDGYIIVNDRLETSSKGVYAAGDAKGGPAFTHIAYDDFRVLKANLIDGESKTIKDRMVPYVLYIDPQLGRIGLSEKAAKAQGIQYSVAKMSMEQVARAIEVGRTRGFLKALIEPETKQILGGAFLGVEGGEIMSMVEIAMLGKLPYTALRDAIFAHPTLAEALNNLFAKVE